MRDPKASGIIRITAGIMGLMMLVIVLFSAFYIAAETDHDCTGEDCPVCACIQLCESTLRGISDGISVASSVIIPFLFILSAAALFVTAVPSDTLISRKVRMNN